MTWTPPHNNFTTFVKDDNNIYIKCADGSWVVLTLRPDPVGPYGGAADIYRKPRYSYLEETWPIIGQRAIPDELSSKIVAYGGRSEAKVFGIKLLGGKLEETRNVFELSGTVSDGINQILEIYGTKSEYLASDFYTFGKKAERVLKGTPIMGAKRDYVETEYTFEGIISTEEIITRLVQGNKRNEGNKIIFASGKTSFPMQLSASIEGTKTDTETKEVNVVGKKNFSKLVEILLMEV